MKIQSSPIPQNTSEGELIRKILEQYSGNRALISGAHQLLQSDGRIETWNQFSKITGELAGNIQSQIQDSRLFLQLNDQLNFEGMSTGRAPQSGVQFWQNPWDEIEEEGYRPDWSPDTLLAAGLDIHGAPSEGLVSEWRLQQWHRQSGLDGNRRFKSKRVKQDILEQIYSQIPQEALCGSTCRANGCAHEVLMHLPFAQTRGFQEVIGLWPDACKGSVIYGSTLACYAAERQLKGPQRQEQVEFTGPFRQVHLFMNTDQPRNLKETLAESWLITVETD